VTRPADGIYQLITNRLRHTANGQQALHELHRYPLDKRSRKKVCDAVKDEAY
jgi:hypothetical protein